MRLFRLMPLILGLIFTQFLLGQKSYNVTFTHEGKTINGTFQTPKDSGRFVTIIICPGSGANDRNGTIHMIGGNVQCLYPDLLNDTLRPYKELAQKLVDSGFAVLRYDKIEYTYPSNLGTITFKKLWLPFESALEYVKTRNDVDTNKIVLLGHSEGSSLIPYVALRHPEVKGLISVAGAYTSFDTLLAFQIKDFTKKCKGDTNTANLQAAQILQYFDMVRNGTLTGATPELFGVSPDVWKDYYEVTDSMKYHYNEAFQKKLFIGLEMDLNVPPATEFDRLKREIDKGDFWLMDGLIHYMNPLDDPKVSEKLADTIVYWLRSRSLSLNAPASNTMIFNLYPNPNSGVMYLSSSLSGEVVIEVLTVEGKVLATEKKLFYGGESLEIDCVRNLSIGNYILKIESEGYRQFIKFNK